MRALLSICIPTYMRPECVQRSLGNYLSIIRKNRLSSLVKICISDNNIDKETRDVVAKFAKRGGMKIKYRQNKVYIPVESGQ